jgi:hypothetical protein
MGPDSATHVCIGGLDVCDPSYLSILVSTTWLLEYILSSAGITNPLMRTTAGSSGHWLRVTAKATPPTFREGLALGQHDGPSLD